MENSNAQSLKEITAKRLEDVIAQLEAIRDEKRRKLDTVINKVSELYGEFARAQINLPMGLPTSQIVIDANKKLIAKLEEEVYRDPVELQFKVLPSQDMPKECYNRDEYATKSHDELEADIKNIKEATETLKQNLFDEARDNDTKNAELANDIKVIEDQKRALQEVANSFEKEEEELLLKLARLATTNP